MGRKFDLEIASRYNSPMNSRIGLGRAFRSRKTILSLALLTACALMCFAVSDLIQYLYPERPIVPDIFFTLIPEISWLAYLTDPIILISVILILAYACSAGRRRLPYFFFTVGLTYLLRGPLMLLTPLGRPTGNLRSYGIFEIFDLKQHGMFPSGHALLTMIIYLLIDERECRWCKRLALVLLILESLALLLSRGHYSIDLVGGYMTAYLAYRWAETYKSRFYLWQDR